jgi:hypothetical protein
MSDPRRSIDAAFLTLLSFAANYYALLVMPNPQRWHYNMTASGFAPFMTAILLGAYVVPGWLVCYGLLSSLRIPKPPNGAGR